VTLLVMVSLPRFAQSPAGTAIAFSTAHGDPQDQRWR
jgi:hypothetical protein